MTILILVDKYVHKLPFNLDTLSLLCATYFMARSTMIITSVATPWKWTRYGAWNHAVLYYNIMSRTEMIIQLVHYHRLNKG